MGQWREPSWNAFAAILSGSLEICTSCWSGVTLVRSWISYDWFYGGVGSINCLRLLRSTVPYIICSHNFPSSPNGATRSAWPDLSVAKCDRLNYISLFTMMLQRHHSVLRRSHCVNATWDTNCVKSFTCITTSWKVKEEAWISITNKCKWVKLNISGVRFCCFLCF